MLIARLQDSHVTVLEAVYENPVAITPLFCGDCKSYIASLSLALNSQPKLKRNIVRLHFAYLSSYFWPAADPATRDEIFHRILFPFLLFTKSRQKTAEYVWDLVGKCFSEKASSSALNWLNGCAALVKAQVTPDEGADHIELMNQINFSVSTKIAGW